MIYAEASRHLAPNPDRKHIYKEPEHHSPPTNGESVCQYIIFSSYVINLTKLLCKITNIKHLNCR